MTDAPILGSVPIVAAPMAGGPTTVALARAVAGAGGLPYLAGGYQTVEGLCEQIGRLRGAGRAPYGVNLFIPDHTEVDRAAFAAYADAIQADADAYGVTLNREPVRDDDHYRDKLYLLIAEPVPVVSFTFGLPATDDIAALRRVGSQVLVTVTNVDEARAAHDNGADGLVVQGYGAGGHSATFNPSRDPEPVGTATLVARVRDEVPLPLVAAGGIDSAATVREVLDAGAQAAAVGTMLLRTDEAGTSPIHRAALADPAYKRTELTRAFTGRPARALHNGFIARHGASAPAAYPAVHHLTRALRVAAAQAGDSDRVHLWAGTGWRNAPTGPAADVIRALTPTR